MEKEYFVLYTPNEMNQAFNMLELDISKNEIFEILKGDDDIKKQVCLIKLNSVDSNIEAIDLIKVLTGQHGPVREICSAKVNEFLKKDSCRKFFVGDFICEALLNALNDIIPTVARNILEVVKFLPENDIFKSRLIERILALNIETEEVSTLSNHEITKTTFKLYWYLETLAELISEKESDGRFIKIIEKCYLHEDYTIREKISKILSKVEGYEDFKTVLKKDTNPYVFFYLK